MKATLILMIAVLAVTATVPALADTLTQQQVLDRWADALGGRDAIARVSTAHLEFKAKLFGLDGTLDQWLDTTGRSHSHVSVGGMFEVHSVFDRDHGWYLDQNGKLSEMGGEDLEGEVSSAYDASWSYLFDGRMPGTVEYAGTEDGTGNHIVRCTATGGKTMTVFLDAATFLPVRSEIPLGDRTQTLTYGDWAAHDGVMFPGTVTQSQGDPQYDATFTIANVTINPTPPPGIFGKPVENASGVTFTAGSPVRDIPIEFNSVHIFTRVSVNGSDPLWFLLDTGASITVLNTDVARSLGLELKGKLEGRGAGEGSVEVNLVPDVSVSLPGVVLDGQTVACIPLADIEARMGRALDGILGYDFISRFAVEIDYHGRTLTLYDRNAFDYQGSGTIVPIVLDGSTPEITATITVPGRDPIEGSFLVDTGASGTIHFARPFSEKNDLAAALEKSYEYVGGYGVGGESSSTVGRIASLQIGDITFESPVCGIAHDQAGAHADPNTAGLIGGQILEHCTVIFDYERKRMILEPNADFDAPFETNWSGLVFRTGGRGDFHTITIARVLPGSPADDAGLKEGDVVVSADGTPASELTAHMLWKKSLKGGGTMNLTVERDGSPREVTLTLRRRV